VLCHPGCTYPPKSFLLHTKRLHVPLAPPMSADPVEEKVHIAHLVETGMTTARRRVVPRASSGRSLLVLAEVHRENRATVYAGIEREGLLGSTLCGVLEKSSMPTVICQLVLCLPKFIHITDGKNMAGLGKASIRSTGPRFELTHFHPASQFVWHPQSAS
jgi:hypothetical protein